MSGAEERMSIHIPKFKFSQTFNSLIGTAIGPAAAGESVLVKLNAPMSPKWTIEPADLAEVIQFNPSLADDPDFQKIQEQVATKALASLYVPDALFEVPSGFSNATTSMFVSPKTREEFFAHLQRGVAAMNRIGEVSHIASRLPRFLTANRWKLAEHLWVAGGVFQHNLAAMAELHRLPRRF
jgi:hypothetical protein